MRARLWREAQRGAAQVKVARVQGRSEILRLSHAAPVRLLPMQNAVGERP